MKKSQPRKASSTLVFLTVICLVGFIHVEVELHVHRKMLQELNQLKEENLELRNKGSDEDMSSLEHTSDKGK